MRLPEPKHSGVSGASLGAVVRRTPIPAASEKRCFEGDRPFLIERLFIGKGLNSTKPMAPGRRTRSLADVPPPSRGSKHFKPAFGHR